MITITMHDDDDKNSTTRRIIIGGGHAPPMTPTQGRAASHHVILWKHTRKYSIRGLGPLQTESSCFCKMKYLLKKETINKSEETHLKELNKIFLMIYGLPKKIFIRTQ